MDRFACRWSSWSPSFVDGLYLAVPVWEENVISIPPPIRLDGGMKIYHNYTYGIIQFVAETALEMTRAMLASTHGSIPATYRWTGPPDEIVSGPEPRENQTRGNSYPKAQAMVRVARPPARPRIEGRTGRLPGEAEAGVGHQAKRAVGGLLPRSEAKGHRVDRQVPPPATDVGDSRPGLGTTCRPPNRMGFPCRKHLQPSSSVLSLS